MAKEGKLGGSVLCLVTQSCLTLCDPLDFSLPDSSVHGDSPGKNTERLPCPPPGIKPKSPTLEVDFLPSGPQGKPNIPLVPVLFVSHSVS